MFQFRDQFGLFAQTGIIAILDVRRVAHFLDGIHQVLHQAAHLAQPGLHRFDAEIGVTAALLKLRGQFVCQRLHVFQRDHVLQQVFNHGLLQPFGGNGSRLAAITARVVLERALEIHVLTAYPFLGRDSVHVHGVLFAFDVAAEYQAGEHMLLADAARLVFWLDLLPIVLLGAFGNGYLFLFKPLLRDHRRDKIVVDHAAILIITRINAVGEEMGIAVFIFVQVRSLVDFADVCAVMAHFPGEIAAIPGFRIGHKASGDARFTPGAILAALMNPNLKVFLLESPGYDARSHAQVTSLARPAGIVSEEFGIVVARGNELSLAAFDVL